MKSIQEGTERHLFSFKSAMTLTGILLFLLPLIYIPHFSTSYASLRYFFFGALSLCLGLATVWTWMNATWIPRAFIRSWYGYGLIAFVVTFVLVSLTSIDRNTSFFSTFQRTDGMFSIVFLTFFLLNIYTLVAIRGRQAVLTLFRASLLGAITLSLLIIFSPDGIGNLFLSSRGGASTGNSSVAGAYILFNIFFGILLFLNAKNNKIKTWWGIGVLVLIASPLFLNWQTIGGDVPYTGIKSLIGTARGALLGIIYGLIVSGSFWCMVQKEKVKKYIGIGLISLIVVGTVWGAIQLLTPKTIIHEGFSQVASGTRFIFWDIAMKGFSERPLVGWGPGNFESVYHQFFNSDMLLLSGGGEMWVDRTHNLFFESLVTGGIILFVALLFFLLSIVGSIVQSMRKGSLSTLEASLLIGVFAGWLLQAQFIFESLLSLSMLFLLTGIVYSFSIKKEETKVVSGSISKNQKFIFLCVAVGFILMCIYTIILPFKKDRKMNLVYNENLPARSSMWKELSGISPMGDGYDSVLTFNKVQDAYNKNTKSIISGDPKLKEAALDELNSVGEQLSFLNSTQDNYGLIYIAGLIDYTHMRIGGNFEGEILERARANAEQSIKKSPTDPQAYWLYAQIESMSGNMDKSKELFEQAVAINPLLPTSHAFVLQLAVNMKDVEYYKSSLIRAKNYISDFKPN